MRSQWICLITVVVFVLCAGLPSTALADMEVRVPFMHLHYESMGIDNSGPIKADVLQDKNGIFGLKVFAFGSIYAITKSQLETINGYKFNAVGVSYSRGYPNVGGRTIYVLLYQIFSTGSQMAAMVVIRERGAPKIIIVRQQPKNSD